jgi:CSLREA domain-containing protein
LRYILAAMALALGLQIIVDQSLVTVRAAAATAGSTYVVNSTDDEPDADPSNGSCFSTPSGKCTLRAAIMQANFATDLNTITVPSGVYVLTRPGYDDTALVGDHDINAPLTIQGEGAGVTIVNGNGAVTGDRVFQILSTAHETSLSGLTIRHGQSLTSTVIGPSQGAGSAAIDAGTDIGVTTDVDGDVRPHGNGFDIGYDESTLRLIYLPLIRK